MKKLIFTVLICFGIMASYAQRIGVKGGLNFAKESDDSKSLLGLQLGVVGDYFFTDNIYANSGLLYSMKGAKYKDGNLTAKWPIHYLEIPINIGYRADLGNDMGFFAQAGPYIGYAVASDFKFGSGLAEIKRFDAGFNVGAGVEYNKFQFGATYGFGLANIANDPGEFKNRVLSLSVVYFLPF